MSIQDYEDIINLQRPVSAKRARMSMIDRGAQFSPFAALVGYEAVLAETARLTEQQTVLDESGKELLDRKLRYIADHPQEAGETAFVCFRQDEWKSGGSYVTIRGKVKKIDPYRRTVLLENGQQFSVEDIRAIESEE